VQFIRRADVLVRSRPNKAGISTIPYLQEKKSAMPNLLIRDLDDDVLQGLKAAAKAHGRSLQAEIHDVLRRANTRNLAETRRLSARWLRRLKSRNHSDSAALIRKDRDSP
jgi:plasmid stability protein